MEEADAWTSQSKEGYADDRIPSMEELRRLLEYPDRRIKPLVCTMASSGIRIGAWDYLRWGNIQPIEREGKIVARQNHSICRRIRAVFLLYANQWTSVWRLLFIRNQYIQCTYLVEIYCQKDESYNNTD